MAIWQYNLIVVPKESIQSDYECIFKANKTDFLPETKMFWKNSKLNALSIASEIDKLIDRANWSNNEYFAWKGNGKNDEDNDCDISINGANQIESFYFRTDLRNETNILNFLSGMLNICETNNLILINLKGEILEPKFEVIIENLKASNATRFLNDPIKFLESLK